MSTKTCRHSWIKIEGRAHLEVNTNYWALLERSKVQLEPGRFSHNLRTWRGSKAIVCNRTCLVFFCIVTPLPDIIFTYSDLWLALSICASGLQSNLVHFQRSEMGWRTWHDYSYPLGISCDVQTLHVGKKPKWGFEPLCFSPAFVFWLVWVPALLLVLTGTSVGNREATCASLVCWCIYCFILAQLLMN